MKQQRDAQGFNTGRPPTPLHLRTHINGFQGMRAMLCLWDTPEGGWRWEGKPFLLSLLYVHPWSQRRPKWQKKPHHLFCHVTLDSSMFCHFPFSQPLLRIKDHPSEHSEDHMDKTALLDTVTWLTENFFSSLQWSSKLTKHLDHWLTRFLILIQTDITFDPSTISWLR